MSGPKHIRPKGTQDFIPPLSEDRRWVEEVARRLSARYGFREVITPIFEHTDVFVKSSGDASDIVTKEMYEFKDRAERSLTLRPEGTPGVVRALLENSMRVPTRLYYIGPYFRYGRPQKGRYREFNQYGVEAVGEASPETDAEIIILGETFFHDVGVADCTTMVNSIGCRECRPGHREALVGFLTQHRDELCEDCRTRIERNPLRVFDCKNESCQAVLADAPKPRERLCPACEEHFTGVRAALDRHGLRYELNDLLVRGLDYYNRTVFEYVSGRLGAQDSLGGGGRYYYLVGDFGGPPTPAAGFAIGLERTVLAMPEPEPEGRRRLAFVVWMTDAEKGAALEVLAKLRAEGVPAMVDHDATRPKRQFRSADASMASCCVIVGPDEVAGGTLSVKDLHTGDQTEVPANLIVGQVRAMFR